MIREAILELLEAYDDVWLRRSQIEEKLNLASVYQNGVGQESYQGSLAAMFLNELVQQKQIEDDWDGSAKVYRRRGKRRPPAVSSVRS